jgi:hypothetical protein
MSTTLIDVVCQKLSSSGRWLGSLDKRAPVQGDAFANAGFSLTRVIPTKSLLSLIEAVPC